jgi:propionate CoA-transferase
MTFGGRYASKIKAPVLYVTERCVFALCEEGIELIEVAPGIDIEKQILALMDFKPVIKSPGIMDRRIFSPEPMGLDTDILNHTA